ncbi:hypothetical protein FBU30_009188 [Linnemannia zychae]|nr:hypothetical protein FBU30_009188 [Linnemannia zychae]
MAPAKTRSNSSKYSTDRGYKADPDSINDDDDIYGMRELKHQLAGLNLQLKDTMGDGNCLFRACADQFSGTEKDHHLLRAQVCQYIEEHEEHFKLFLDNETVEAHVTKMRKNGTYGGNIELVAFARMKRVDIKVYQPGYIYVIEGVDVKKEGSSPGQRPVMHIAYHSWEHYSSIRNIDGPYEGPPEINPRPIKQEPLRKLTSQDPPRSIERAIIKATGVDDLVLIRELMEKYKGDVDSVYNEIYDKVLPEMTTGNDEQAEEDDKTNGDGTESKSSKEGLANIVEKESKESNRKKSKKDVGPEALEENSIPDKDATTASMPPQLSNENTSTGTASTAQTPAPTEEPVKGIVPKKRLSSREKKEAAKRNQKLNRKNKGKTNSTGDNSSSSEKSLPMSDKGVSSTSSTMRELFV